MDRDGVTKKLIVLGDNLAERHNDIQYDNWTWQLARELNIPRGQVRNVAKAGATLPEIAFDQLPLVYDERPTLAVLAAGTSDVFQGFDHSSYGQVLAEVLEWATTATVAAVLPVPLPPLSASRLPRARRDQIHRRVSLINKQLKHHATQWGAAFVSPDAPADITVPESWRVDCVRFSELGHSWASSKLIQTVQAHIN